MSEQVSASETAPQVVTGPVVVSDDMYTVVSHSRMVPSNADQIKADLADPPADPAKPAEASAETPETPAEPVADTPPVDGETPETPAADGKPNRRDRAGRLRAEIHALTQQKYQTKAEIADLAKKREELRRELERPTSTPAQADAGPRSAGTQGVHADDLAALGPRPSWSAYDAAGKDFAEYEADLDAWTDRKTDLRIAREMRTREAQAQRSQAERTVQEQAAALEASHHEQLAAIEREDPEFQTRVKTVLDQFEVRDVPPPEQRGPNGEIGHFMLDTINAHPAGPQVLRHWVQHEDQLKALVDLNEQGRLTGAMMIAVKSAADPVPLLQHLATHPRETAEIGSLPRDKALLALGQISARLSVAQQQAPTPAAPVTRAPLPIRPVGGTRTTGDAVDIYDLPADKFYEAYVQRENAARRRP